MATITSTICDVCEEAMPVYAVQVVIITPDGYRSIEALDVCGQCHSEEVLNRAWVKVWTARRPVGKEAAAVE